MGLSVSAGCLADFIVREPDSVSWYAGEVATVNQALQDHGFPTFTEPEKLGRPFEEACGFSYRELFCLFRVYALQHEGLPYTPTSTDQHLPAADNELVARANVHRDSHLLSDGAYFAPVDFPRPIFSDAVEGGAVKSSHGLLHELIHLAPFIGITLDEGEPTEAARARMEEISTEQVHSGQEQWAWFVFYDAAQFSVQNETMIFMG